MKVVGTEPVAQGDILIRRIDALPESIAPVEAQNGELVLAHSETGHHHVVKEHEGTKLFQDTNDAVVSYLQVIGDDVALEHKRNHDTHESFSLPAGNIYQINRQVESSAQGIIRAAD